MEYEEAVETIGLIARAQWTVVISCALRSAPLAVPLFFGTYGVYAGLPRTCGFTALRAHAHSHCGAGPVADRDELRRNRKRGISMIAGSAGIATTATALLVLAH